jgi:hypothetical protein
MVERVTIDATVVHDYRNPKRSRHKAALKLFQLAQIGTIELSIAPQAFRLDASGDLHDEFLDIFEREQVREEAQIARVSEVTYPAEDLFPEMYDEALVEAWEQIASSWRSHEGKPPGDKDRWHIETHIVAKRDVFLTDDKALLSMCHRLEQEYGIPIRAMSLKQYLCGQS